MLFKPTVTAVLTSLISLLIWAGLGIGANFGLHPALTVLGLLWLVTIGLPTSVGVVLVSSLWGRIDLLSGLPGFLIVAPAVGGLLQVLAVSILWRRAATARAKGRSWKLRQIVLWSGGAVIATAVVLGLTYRPTTLPGAVTDGHAHLFGDHGWPPIHKHTSGLSPAQKANPTYGLLTRLLQMPPTLEQNEAYIQALARQTEEVRRLVPGFRVVLLAQDCRYAKDGAPDWSQSTVYVPNEELFQVVNRFPELFIPCPSINPQRGDWAAELAYCVSQGARVLKIHPPTQAVDPSNPQFREFYRQCAAAGVRIMVHTGAEHSAPIAASTLGDPRLLELALEEGCTVIAAHAGTKAFFDPPAEDHFPELAVMMERHSRLYADTAVLESQFRWRTLPPIIQHPLAGSRTVQASDWPFPSNAFVFWHRLHPVTLVQLMAEKNLFLRDLRLKQALGLPADAFPRMGEVLGGGVE